VSPTYREIDVRLRLLNARQFQRDMVRAGNEMKGIAAANASAAQRMASAGRGLRTFGGNMTRHVTVPLGFAAVASAKFAATFHQNMRLIQTQAGGTAADVSKLTPQVLKLAQTMPQGPQELAKGLYHLKSLNIANPMRALEVAAKGAAIGQADLESTTSALGAAMFVGTKGTMGLEATMALLDSTVGQGNMRMMDLVNALGKGVLPAAKFAGLSIQQVMAALALFSDSGMNASSAAAQFGTSLHYFTDPSTKARKALHKLHMGTFQMAQDMRGPQGMIGALKDLRDHLSGLSDTRKAAVLGDLFPAGRGKVILTQLAMLDREQMRFGRIQKNASKQNFMKRWEAQGREPMNKMRTAWSQIQVAIIHFGDAALPVIVSITKEVAKIATAFSGLPAPVQHAIVGMTLFLAAVGPLSWAIGGTVSGLGKMVTGLKWLITWERRASAQSVATAAMQKRNALGQLMPIGRGTKFARLLNSNSKWSGAKLATWMGAAVAAGIAGWEIGKWLRKHIPGVRIAGDWLGRTFANAFGVGQSLKSRIKEKSSQLSSAQAQAKTLQMLLGRHKITTAEFKRRMRAIQQELLAEGFHVSGARGWGGTVSRSGRYLLGERGPELVNLPPAARVTPLTPSIANAFAASEGGGDGGGTHWHLYIDGKELSTSMVRVEKRKAARK
jgi:TP901 family phage tail tape measure protein